MVLVPTSAQSSAASCSRSRARPRGGAAAGDPAPARAFVRLDHERLPTRDRRRGDHRHGTRATRTDDARQRRPRTLRPAGHAGGSAAPRNRPQAGLSRFSGLGQHDPPRRYGSSCSDSVVRLRLVDLDRKGSARRPASDNEWEWGHVGWMTSFGVPRRTTGFHQMTCREHSNDSADAFVRVPATPAGGWSAAGRRDQM
jgi:hypothetical protein